jgi:alkylation response protein AidB-like acyl-CoA dehydrogenase
MSSTLEPDEAQLALRAYFAGSPGIAQVRGVREGTDLAAAGFDRDDWARLTEQVGLAALGAPEVWGGLGLGACHLAAAVEECGASLHPGPARGTALLGAGLAALSPDALPASVASSVAAVLAGTAVVGLAGLTGDRLAVGPDGTATGTLSAVTHGAVADLVVAAADLPAGPAIVLVLVAPETARSPRRTIDFVVPRADLSVCRAPAVALTRPGDRTAYTRLVTLARLLLAAEQVGGAQACLTAMVDYALLRHQFGELIGSYQAIQHRCATVAVDVAAARALVAAAAAALDGPADAHDRAQDRAEPLALLARAEAAECFVEASAAYVQLSGGIGFTWEHDAHLYFRHARATAPDGGTPAQLREAAVKAGCLDLLTAPVG